MAKKIVKKQHVISYLRVSSDKQTIQTQKRAIQTYCKGNGLTIAETIEITISSKKTTRQRRIDELLERLQSGSILIVSELSRLARSVGEIAILVDELKKREIRFIAIKDNIDINGNGDINSLVQTTLFSLLAQIEREFLSLRTKEGIERVKAEGKKVGRPKLKNGEKGKSKLDGRNKELQKYMDKNLSINAIAKLMDVSYPTIYNYIRKIEGIEYRTKKIR